MTINKKAYYKQVLADEGKVLVTIVQGEEYFCKIAFAPLEMANTQIKKLYKEVPESD